LVACPETGLKKTSGVIYRLLENQKPIDYL
jgi:hypothetical protein